MSDKDQKEFGAFDEDAKDRGGYLYTKDRLSSRLANQRFSDASFALTSFEGLRVLDLGCGDGTYTRELYDRMNPSEIVAVDPASSAVDLAERRAGERNISFSVCSAYELPFDDQEFDIAYLRGVLHHMEEPERAIGEALRVAKCFIAVEPNGYSPVLKMIEKLSPYHREHNEKSYWPPQLDKWVERAGGRVTVRRWANLVPCFCPDWFAKILKKLEPLVESIPGVRHICCGVYVFLAEATRIPDKPE
tara:strand:- start:1437 stop:2177 length:741 start_codon:yes stop_codon:yes gene_type:complete